MINSGNIGRVPPLNFYDQSLGSSSSGKIKKSQGIMSPDVKASPYKNGTGHILEESGSMGKSISIPNELGLDINGNSRSE